MNKKLYGLLIVCCLLVACDQSSEQAIDHSALTAQPVDKKYIWDLTDLFADIKTWETARIQSSDKIKQLRSLKGTLGDSAQSLLRASDQISQVYKDVARVYVYANLMADMDTRNAENEERSQMARNLLTELGTAVSWYNPELLALGESKLKAFIAQEPKLKKHGFSIENSLR